MSPLQAVFIVIVLIFFMILSLYMFPRSYELWRAKRHPYYNRKFTAVEEQFLAGAQQDLREFSAKESAVPRLYFKLFGWSYLPAMVIAWAFLYGIWYGLLKLVHWPLMNKIKNGDVLFFDYGVGISAVVAVFLVISLAGYCLYWITARYRNFHIGMMLNGISNEGEALDELLARQMKGIEDALRLKKLSPSSRFSSEDFLYGTSTRARRAFGLMTLAVLAVTVFFGFFDLRQTTVFYPDRLAYKSYWSGEPIVINYNEISGVRISCVRTNSIRTSRRPNISTSIVFNTQSGATYKPLSWTRGSSDKFFEGFEPDRATVVNGAAQLDSILRKTEVPFETVSNNQYCFEKFVTRSRIEHREQWRLILHMLQNP